MQEVRTGSHALVTGTNLRLLWELVSLILIPWVKPIYASTLFLPDLLLQGDILLDITCPLLGKSKYPPAKDCSGNSKVQWSKFPTGK
jgi:hypothetical protein